MTSIKATGIVFIKNLMEKSEEETFSTFWCKLDSDDKKYYDHALPYVRVPLANAAHIFRSAAEVLRAGDPEGLENIGCIMAKNHLSTMYKSMVRGTSVTDLLNQAPQVWYIQHEKGEVAVDVTASARQACLHVRAYPELPPALRKLATGYFLGALELSGQSYFQIRHEDKQPHHWQWFIQW